MPKRTAEEKIRRYKKKLRKLEKQAKPRRVISSDSDSSEENEGVESTPTPEPIQHDVFAFEDFPEIETAVETQNDQTGLPIEFSNLDPLFLEALGEDNVEEPEFGVKIHEDLAKRWLPLIKKGLPKDTKEKLLKEYLVPENLKLLQAPSLNSELTAALMDTVKSRDNKLKNNQKQLGSGIVAANRALHELLSNGDKLEAVKHLSNCCRVLLDLHALETKWRRILITMSMDKSFYKIIQDSESDSTLFGSDLSEKIKNSKSSEKLGFQFKKPPIRKNNVPQTSFRPMNQGNGFRPRPSTSRGGRGGSKKSTPAQPARRYPPANTHTWPTPYPTPYPSTSRYPAPTHR